MLSKLIHMPYDASYDLECNSYRIEPKNPNCSQEVETWQATLSNGKIVTIEIGRTYDMSNFTLELDSEEYYDVLNNSKKGTIVINNFDYNVDYIRLEKELWVEINGISIDNMSKIKGLTFKEKQELYRIIYKWDIIERTEKSSGSESDSDSDFDEEKLTHNNCSHISTKYAIVNGYNVNKL